MTGRRDTVDGEHFIAVSKVDLVRALADRPALADTGQSGDFGLLCRLVGAVVHYQHFDDLQTLKDGYQPFSPHHPVVQPATEAPDYATFLATLRAVLVRANFIEVGSEEIDHARRASALFRVNVHAETHHFRDVLFFRRGRHRERVERKFWLGLRTRHEEIDVYDDVVMVAALHETEPPPPPRHRRLLRARRRPGGRPGSMLIKCFRDIPSADLNALLPDARVVMAPRDKWLLGLPALLAGIPLLLKLGPVLAILAILAGIRFGATQDVSRDGLEQALIVTSGLIALGGFFLQQWVKYQRQALRYQLEINSNLYFRNVSNNAGMFDAIIGAAEEQECKEVILAYAFLLEAPSDSETLDRRIEAWLAERFGVAADYEVDDAIGKLRRLGLVADADGIFAVPPIPEALHRLDALWDGFFVFPGRPGEAETESHAPSASPSQPEPTEGTDLERPQSTAIAARHGASTKFQHLSPML